MEGMSIKDVSLMLRDNDFPEETIENLKSEWAAAIDLCIVLKDLHSIHCVLPMVVHTAVQYYSVCAT